MKTAWSKYDSGGVPGIHWYMDLVRCARKAQLNLRPKGGRTYSKGTAIGTIGHSYAEALYTCPGFDGALEFEDVPEDIDGGWLEIGHMVGARYARERRHDEFGKVVCAEKRFFLEEKDASELAQPTFLPFSGQPDLVIDIDLESAKRLRVDHGMFVDPGAYVVDHKFYSRRRATIVDEMLGSLQFEAYRRMAQLAFPDVEIKGTIANLVFYYTSKSNPRNEYMLIPVLPSREMDAVFTKFWDLAASAIELAEQTEPGEDWSANPVACFSGYACDHFLGGACQRA